MIDRRFESKARQLIVCCDGTSNTVTGGLKDTNVVRLVDMLRAGGSRSDPDQLVYYDPGVGSPDGLPPTGLMGFVTEPAKKALGLGVGSGIYENIGQAYLFLCREYGKYETLDATETKDEIYLFGFSRGAFTVRAVAGLVQMFGLIRPEQEQLLPTLLNVYFTPRPERPQVAVEALRSVRGAMVGGRETPVRDDIADQIRLTHTTSIGAEARIHFIGVWDTVKSVGVPGLRKEITNDASIKGLRITHVRHLLSLDEHRRQFLARPFVGQVTEGRQSLRQYWVRGVHGDIGGGGNEFTTAPSLVKDDKPTPPPRRTWKVSALSEVTFSWMVAEAKEVGLRHVMWEGQDPPDTNVIVDPQVHITDQLHTTPWWTVTGMALRKSADIPAGNVLLGGVERSGRPQDAKFEAEPLDHPSVSNPWAGAKPYTASSPWTTLDVKRRWRSLAWASVCVWLIFELREREDVLSRLAMLVAAVFLAAVLSTRAYSLRLVGRVAGDERPWLEGRGTKREVKGAPAGARPFARWRVLFGRLEPGVLTISPLGNVVSFVLVGGLGAIAASGLGPAVGWGPAEDALRVVGWVFLGVLGIAAGGSAVLLVDGLLRRHRWPLVAELVGIGGSGAVLIWVVGSGAWLHRWVGDHPAQLGALIVALVLLSGLWPEIRALLRRTR